MAICFETSRCSLNLLPMSHRLTANSITAKYLMFWDEPSTHHWALHLLWKGKGTAEEIFHTPVLTYDNVKSPEAVPLLSEPHAQRHKSHHGKSTGFIRECVCLSKDNFTWFPSCPTKVWTWWYICHSLKLLYCGFAYFLPSCYLKQILSEACWNPSL